MTPTSSTVELPRGLIFLASLWLIGSWGLAIGLRPPVDLSSASYTPQVRMMLLCVTTGLTIVWPLLRLSQQSTARPLAQTMLDVVALLALMQVVVWPLRLVTPWSPLRTAAIDATLAGWMLLVGALIASAAGSSRRGPRSLAMAACVCLYLLGPGLAWIGVMAGIDASGLLGFSPVMAVMNLTEGAGARPDGDQWRTILTLALAAAVAWCGLSVWMLLPGRSDTGSA